MSNPVNRQAGFSLVELLVAMTITLIISGAIFGLLAGGQTAFRREPELTDRQQNARLALALLERDLYRAGAKQPLSTQVFRNTLNGLGPQGLSADSDFLEIVANDDECPDVPVNIVLGVNVNVVGQFPTCYTDNTLVMLYYPDGTTKWGFGHVVHGQQEQLNFPPGLQPPTSQIQSQAAIGSPARIGLLVILRYEIAITDGVPSLYRSARGGFRDTDGVYVAAPDPAGGWQLVARGIEDLQVRYELQARYPPSPSAVAPTSVWQDTPGVVVTAGGVTDPDTVVRRVEVMLSARAMAANLQGQTTNAILGDAVRGQLATRVSPRATLLNLQDPVQLALGKGWY